MMFITYREKTLLICPQPLWSRMDLKSSVQLHCDHPQARWLLCFCLSMFIFLCFFFCSSTPHSLDAQMCPCLLWLCVSPCLIVLSCLYLVSQSVRLIQIAACFSCFCLVFSLFIYRLIVTTCLSQTYAIYWYFQNELGYLETASICKWVVQYRVLHSLYVAPHHPTLCLRRCELSLDENCCSATQKAKTYLTPKLCSLHFVPTFTQCTQQISTNSILISQFMLFTQWKGVKVKKNQY